MRLRNQCRTSRGTPRRRSSQQRGVIRPRRLVALADRDFHAADGPLTCTAVNTFRAAMECVGLAIIVVIRTVLSMALQVEIEALALATAKHGYRRRIAVAALHCHRFCSGELSRFKGGSDMNRRSAMQRAAGVHRSSVHLRLTLSLEIFWSGTQVLGTTRHQ